MAMRRSLYVLACLLALLLPWLTASCAKKAVQTEEILVPEETVAAERPESEIGETPGPTEEAISEDEQVRRETYDFTNRDILFDFDRYDLKSEAKEILADKAYFLKKYTSVKILIEGQCDERGTNEYNLALGERRANSAKQYLVNLGIAENRISTISYGEERPLDPGKSEQAWAKNRRAHFEVISN